VRPQEGAAFPRIAGYEVIGQLAAGAMGAVYRARDLSTEAEVALTLVGPAPEGPSAPPEARLRHPGIVPVHDAGVSEGLGYVVRPLPARSLANVLHGKPMSPGAASLVIHQVAEAVAYAHAAGVVHGDLRPEAIELAEGEPVRVTGFRGTALPRPADPGLTPSGAVLGAPDYLAPEQASGERGPGPAADVYALGAILYECLTGRPPFKSSSLLEGLVRAQTERPVPPRSLNPAVPPELEMICLKCLEKDPSRRYRTCQELADDLARALGGRAVLAGPAAPAAPLQASYSKTLLGDSAPPIKYNCPRCRTPLEASASEAGTKKNCPNCSQRLQVPAPTKLEPVAPPANLNKTMLAASAPAEMPVPQWSGPPPRRRSKLSSAWVLAGGLLAALALGYLVWWWLH
jgi:serine/threonine protein kinase